MPSFIIRLLARARAALAPPTPAEAPAMPALAWLVRRDQLLNVRHTVLSALLINVLLGMATLAVAWQSGRAAHGLAWFCLTLVVNAARIWMCIRPLRATPPHAMEVTVDGKAEIDRHLRLSWILALLSGSIWSLLGLLCDLYTSPQTLFYLTILCGISAGSVTHGIAYRAIPIAFITPVLLSVSASLAWHAATTERQWLALAVLLYLAALMRSALHSERNFRVSSRLQHEATELARSLQRANERAHHAARELHRNATHDTLTGLLNRDGFMLRADERMAAQPGRSFCLMLLDLDGFKAVNDTFGHALGDAMLAKVGHWLEHDLPTQLGLAPGMLCSGRMGGDEFLLLYPMHNADQDVGPLAQTVIDAYAPHGFIAGQQLGMCIGAYKSSNQSARDMLGPADEALYAAKQAGRNRYHLYDEVLQHHIEAKREIERDLQAAIQGGQIALHYQPIISAATGRTDTLEALLRWNHPQRGWIRPEDVVQAAAHNGLTRELLAHTALATAQALARLRHAGHSDVRVAMNISPRDVARLPVDDIISETFARLAVPLSALEIEITEESALDLASTHDKLVRLAQAGVVIAADDFGIGYSSMALIKSGFIKRLKIDRSFVRGLGQEQSNEPFVATALNLGRALGLEVVAEGVETQAQAERLRAMGCSLMQGLLFAAPMPFDEALAWMQRQPRAALP